jgi:uncharacterized protein (DUF362 family)/Pyruvate/2-oxoacid:ferredoxin oxidoreductase delta subunit
MEKSVVALVNCTSYEKEMVSSAVKRGVDLLGGIGTFLTKDEKILLKPNVLAGDEPERCVTTHPSILEAVVPIVREYTPHISVGDSPGGGDPVVQLKGSGLAAIAEELGIEVADFSNGKEIYFEDNPYIKRFLLANGVLEADGLISLSKMKTHALTRMTGALKNQFGCIPGSKKKTYHITHPSAYDFSRMLVSLSMAIRPRLYIMDAVMAMQGNGPRGGSPAEINALLFSTDPIALDAVMCRLVALKPEYLPSSTIGKEMGMGTYLEEEIELIGDSPDSLINRTFKVNRRPFRDIMPTGAVSAIKNLIIPRPAIDKQACVMCGACVKACPVDPKALNWKKGRQTIPPVYTYLRCIRCYCCQEICPEAAIHVKSSAFEPFKTTT